jgi:hypothetical protein
MLYSFDGEAGISLGFLGVGYTSNAEISDGYFHGRLLNFIYQSEIGIGLSVSPLVFHLGIKNNDYSSLTFVNASLFYNFFRETRSFLILGPFISVNAVKYNNPWFAEFRSGLTFSLRNLLHGVFYSENDVFNSDFFHVELGYRYNENEKHGFYIHAGVDLLAVLWFFASVKANDYENYQKKNPRY